MDVSMAARNVAGGGQRISVFAVMGGLTLAVLWAVLRQLVPARPTAAHLQ